MNLNAKKLSFRELGDKIKNSISVNMPIDYEIHLIDIEKILNNRDGGSIIKKLEEWIDNINNSIEKGRGLGSFNFYPSQRKGSCRDLCVGVATKKFDHKFYKNKNRTGFKGLIMKLIEHWFTCDLNKSTIILTTHWDQQKFDDDWRDIIESYCANGNHVVEIYYLMDLANYEAIQVF